MLMPWVIRSQLHLEAPTGMGILSKNISYSLTATKQQDKSRFCHWALVWLNGKGQYLGLRNKNVSDSTDLSVVTPDMRWDFVFHQLLQYKFNICIWKHTATAMKRVGPLRDGHLGNHLLLFVFDVIVYNPTRCMWHTDKWEHHPPLPPVKMEWMNKTPGGFFALFFTLEWDTTPCDPRLHAGYQSEKNFGSCILPVTFIYSIFPHEV